MYKKKYAMFSLEGDMLVDGIVRTALKNRFDFKWVEQKLEKLAETKGFGEATDKGFGEATDTHVLDMVWDAMQENANVL